jgi:hypothetical protein
MQHPWWIKERDNPQLGVYYVGCGQLSKTAAKRYERCLYGSATMLPFATEAEYKERLAELGGTKDGK